MQSEQRALRETLAATPHAVPKARHLLIEFARRYCPEAPDIVEAVGLTVTEAVANVVRHAYPDHAGIVELSATVEDESLVVTISDHGVGVATTSPTPARFGLPIMRRMAQATFSKLQSGGVQAVLRFPCPPTPTASDSPSPRTVGKTARREDPLLRSPKPGRLPSAPRRPGDRTSIECWGGEEPSWPSRSAFGQVAMTWTLTEPP